MYKYFNENKFDANVRNYFHKNVYALLYKTKGCFVRHFVTL